MKSEWPGVKSRRTKMRVIICEDELYVEIALGQALKWNLLAVSNPKGGYRKKG